MHAEIAVLSSEAHHVMSYVMATDPYDGAVLVLFMSGLVSVGLKYRRPCASPSQPPHTGAGPSALPASPELGCELIALGFSRPVLASTTFQAYAARFASC